MTDCSVVIVVTSRVYSFCYFEAGSGAAGAGRGIIG